MSNYESDGARRATEPELNQPEHGWAISERRERGSAKKPRHLADWSRLQSDRRKVENDGSSTQTFTLPLEAARRKVRDIIDAVPQRGQLEIVERWRQLPDGLIEFTMRRLPRSD
jgi:hypothetical protein